MDKIVIKGARPYDGEWEFDSGFFTNRELHTIKRISGLRAGELNEALKAGDTDLVVALAVVALQRHGKQVDEDTIWDAEGGDVQFVGVPDTSEEGDEGPPGVAAPSDGSSGAALTDSSEPPASPPSRTGSPLSAIGAASA